MVKGREMIKEVVSKLDKLGHIPDLFLKTGLALAGYQATGHWTGSLTALVGLRLAESRNLAAGAAGVATLGLVGLSTAFKPQIEQWRTSLEANVPYWSLGDYLSLLSPGTGIPKILNP